MKIQEAQMLEQNFQQLLQQKQMFSMELNETDFALKELENAGEEVFKIVGGQIIIKTDKKKLKRINDLIKDISRQPFDGIGKPEPLKYKYAGFWSRRIDDEHRLIYQVKDNELFIAKCRFHYD
jgi:toxin YoeB